MLLIICLGLFSLAFLLFVKENFMKKNLPPGPYRFPIVGSLIQVNRINSKAPYLALDVLHNKYGDIMSFQLGSLFAVVLSSFEVMQECMTKTEWSGRMYNEWVAERSFNKELGIVFNCQLDAWQDLRRFTTKALKNFGFAKKDTIHLIMQKELNEVLKGIKTSIRENKGIHTFDCYFTLSVLNVLWSMIEGKRYEHDHPKILRLIRILRDLMESGNMGNSFLMAYPKWKDYFPNLTGMTLQRKCYAEIQTFMQEVINERRKLGLYKQSPENFVDEFIREIDIHRQENETVFADEQLSTVMFDLFLAGSETTSHTLSWSILYMVLHPEIQKKVQAEIDLVVPRGSFPALEHELKLDYTRATIMETHRLGTVLPIMPVRKVLQDTYCKGYFIPKDTYVLPNTYTLFHDKSHWTDPDNFRPERFLDETGKFQHDEWMRPFGFGKRICLGESLASLSLFYYFTVLMQNFTFYQVPGEPAPTMEPFIGFTNKPHPFKALVKIRP